MAIIVADFIVFSLRGPASTANSALSVGSMREKCKKLSGTAAVMCTQVLKTRCFGRPTGLATGLLVDVGDGEP